MNSHHAEGLEAFHAGRFSGAAELLGRALQEQESSELWNDWGTAQFCCEQLQLAEEGFRRALELDACNTEAAANLVVILVNQGRPGEAAAFVDTVAPAFTEAQRESLLAFVTQAQSPLSSIQEFLDTIYRLPQIDRQLPLYKQNALARSYFDSSSFVSACLLLLRRLPQQLQLQAAQVMEKLSPQNNGFAIAAALYHLEVGDFAAAGPLLHHACDRNPTDLYAEQLLIRCELAQAKANNVQHPTFSGLDQYLEQSFCSKPWEHFEVVNDGAVFMCCSGWMPVPIGNLKESSVMDIWNSPMAQEIRASVRDGSFRFCSKLHCSAISGRTLPARTADLAHIQSDHPRSQAPEPKSPVLTSRGATCESGPTLLVLSHDPSCNLACPACRNDFLMVNTAEQAALEAMQNKLIEEAFGGLRVLFLDGAGEAFYSKPSRNMLKTASRERFPDLRFNIITNGQLFNRRTFEEFDLGGRIENLYVSMDAATEEVYRTVRRGGDFGRLLENLEFVKDLRKRGDSFPFFLLFVVSAHNFRDMPAFVRLGRSFDATRVVFTAIRTFGNLREEEFARANVESPDHPEHAAFLDILNSQELEDPIVDLASISHFRKPHKAAGA